MNKMPQDYRLFPPSTLPPTVRWPEHGSEFAPSANDSVDIGQLWSALRRRWVFIFSMALVIGCFVMAYTFASDMRFRAVSQLYLGDVERRTNVAQDPKSGLDLSGGPQEQVASEVEILRSRSLVKRTVLEAGLNATIAPAGQQRLTYWQWRQSGRNLDLIDGALGLVQPTDTTLAPNILKPRRYRVRFLDSSAYVLSEGKVSLGQGKLGEPQHASGLTLTLVAGSRGQPTSGLVYDIVVSPLDLVVDNALRSLRVTAPKETAGGESINVVTLEFNSFSPHLATNFLQKLMMAYLNQRQGWKTEEAQAAEAFVSNQLDSVRKAREQLQAKLAEYRSSNGVVVLDDQAKAMVEQIGKYEEQRANARLQVAAFTDMARALKAPDPPIGAFMLGDANDRVLENMADSLSKAKEKLTDLETRFQDVAPEVQQQRAQVAAHLDAVRNYVSSRQMRAQSNLGTLHAIIGQFENKLKTVPGAELGLAQLTRESEVYNNTYSYLLERQQQAGIIKASTLSKNRVLDAPELPLREDSPMLPLRFASVLVGLLVGAGIVVVRSLFARTIQGHADLQRTIGTVPILASIPRRPWRRKNVPSDLVAQYPNSRFTEAFRALRVKLYSLKATDHGTVLVVTSPNASSGTTTCVRSIASVLCADGKSVLMVDANLRRNARRGRRKELQVPGLREFLTGSYSWLDVVRRIRQSFSLLFFIPAGGTDQPELLTKGRMRRFLQEARETFDFVLIDCPSFPQASEALALSQMADGTLSVLRLRKTPKHLASEHIAQISGVARFNAVVVSDADIESNVGAKHTATEFGRMQAAVQFPFDGLELEDDYRSEGENSQSLVVPRATNGSVVRYQGPHQAPGKSSRA